MPADTAVAYRTLRDRATDGGATAVVWVEHLSCVLDEVDRLRAVEVAAQVAVDSHGHDTEYAAMESLEAALTAPSSGERGGR